MQTPPVHLMLAAYFGIKTSDKKNEDQSSELGQLIATLPQDSMVLPKGDLTIGSGKKKD